MSIYDTLNREQKRAVMQTDGPLLMLAGAGSGKTRALTHRIAYLIGEMGVKPWNILAITFTNKAAGEMRERVDSLVGFGSDQVWVSTFHSACMRILRRHIDRIGYDNSFTVYDTDDQKTVMMDVCKRLNIDTKTYKERTILSAISGAKDELISVGEYEKDAAFDFVKAIYAKAYREYQETLQKNNALDFDDIIMKTVELFKSCPEVLDYYQERFQYIMVDEYQDTNTAQFELVRLLADKYRNLCVVGDDDQSIYKFRGANIRNILDFEKVFPATKVIRLEQNYRSTGNILKAANEVILHNHMRKEKSLWTDAEEGEPLKYCHFETEYDEAQAVSSDIHKKVIEEGKSYADFAILYRTNAQSRVFEEKLVYEGIPYRIIGAINFYARREIKDLLCYLKTINNSADDIAIKRIINIPKRGIGQTTIGRITDYAIRNEISFYDALKMASMIPGCSRAAANIDSFVSLIELLRSKLSDETYTLENLIQEIIDTTGYVRQLEAEDTVEAHSRIENIDSLINKIVQYEEDCEEMPTLDGLLEDIALVADIDTVSEDTEQVLLMTLHSAKGLEFPCVYMCGMEENIFPGSIAVFGDNPDDMEEERRLCYVGITRAMKNLTLTSASRRMRNGNVVYNPPSRFLREIPRYLMTETNRLTEKQERAQAFSAPSAATGTKKEPGNLFQNNPYIQKGFRPAPAVSASPDGKPDYEAGDMVSHTKFGIGRVVSLKDISGDYEVVIEFEDFGKRKLRSSFARLLKIKK